MGLNFPKCMWQPPPSKKLFDSKYGSAITSSLNVSTTELCGGGLFASLWCSWKALELVRSRDWCEEIRLLGESLYLPREYWDQHLFIYLFATRLSPGEQCLHRALTPWCLASLQTPKQGRQPRINLSIWQKLGTKDSHCMTLLLQRA